MSEGIECIAKILESQGVFIGLFNIIRIVDVKKGVLIEYSSEGKLVETGVCCTDLLNASERCKNCTSSRAYYTNETAVKLEYLNGAVMLVFSNPIEIEGERYVVELIKDISKSMQVHIEDESRVGEITGIIDNLNRIAMTDSLTGLYNRRYIDEHLQDIIKYSGEVEAPLSVAMADLDDFKLVNDTYGHAAGDFVLSSIGAIISMNIQKKANWAARYGGEELLICFPGTDVSEATRIVEQIREQIQNTAFEFEGLKLHITSSFGVAQMLMGDTKESLLSACDGLLFRAKNNGKNRVEIWRK